MEKEKIIMKKGTRRMKKEKIFLEKEKKRLQHFWERIVKPNAKYWKNIYNLSQKRHSKRKVFYICTENKSLIIKTRDYEEIRM